MTTLTRSGKSNLTPENPEVGFTGDIPYDPSTLEPDLPEDVVDVSITIDTTEEISDGTDEFLLGTLGHRRLRVHLPFAVKLDTENEDYIAEVEVISEFGFGKSISEAVADLQRAIVDLYFTLEEDQNRLGPDLDSVWRTLQEMVSRAA